ncbi:MAG: hypothetical protein J6B63_06170 [Treponema sp.]|nr:hypothetical protein [Treponema sp.]
MDEFNSKVSALTKLKQTGIKSSVEFLALAPVDFVYCIPDLTAEEFSHLCEFRRRAKDGTLLDYILNSVENLQAIKKLQGDESIV